MTSSTPDKIKIAIEELEIDVARFDDNLKKIEDLSLECFTTLLQMLSRFDDVPVERLRSIRPLIESVQSKIDVAADSSVSLKDLIESLKNVSEDLTRLRIYFNDQYMTSVKNRSQRGR